ncbi:MAG: hypothetical protein XD84_0182 [Desulfotomaculum sp. 46_80]|nr:MAG: hypothetical protein XD84_0182 [Desulfotomaculum sp. 46_80]
MFQLKNYRWVLIVIGLVAGFMFSYQFRLTRNIEQNPSLYQAQTLLSQVNESRDERSALRSRAEKLRAELDKAMIGAQLSSLKDELNSARMEAGLIEVKGPGVEVTLNDSAKIVQPGENPNLYVLHDEDVLKVINELKAAGARALSINGQRLLADSEIRCVGPTILTNKFYRLTPPFIISAVGDPDNMVKSLQMRGGIIEQLQFWSIQVSVKKASEITIPAYSGSIRFNYAKPIFNGENKNR